MIKISLITNNKHRLIPVIEKYTPLIPTYKLGLAGVLPIFLIFDPKHRLLVLVRAVEVVTCTHNLCFGPKY